MNKTSYMQIDLFELGKQLEAGNAENLFMESGDSLICCAGCKVSINSIANNKWFLRCEQEERSEAVKNITVTLDSKELGAVCGYRPEVSE
ncbi:hypothetical protein [Brochothrix thermosphacta]|uniref:hypothetical protein n=1 Tax=Brochothrix thermosphacta TaxID=2756 RepID=UPI0003E863C9|nr:hypothetical protein [Brochothrix thermosphacta]EUJ38191.1 hypothetical protein BTHER_02415 [Brochothrix thermosphacta DSM 20171 = FSL F6-1036]ODJ49214.1 hypothetical protein BFR34_06130 [Brochothrix thermosphacta DSM 20171 = FSL F6-1036]